MNNERKNHDNQQPLKEIISPEGVEERVHKEITFRLTQTQGGKFRAYMDNQPVLLSATSLQQAEKEFAERVAIFGHMSADPVGTMRTILGIKG